MQAIEAAQSNDRKMVRRGKKIRLAEHGREETNMISRLWHGWTTRDNADAYKEPLRSAILPGFIASRDSRERCYFGVMGKMKWSSLR